MLLNVSHCVAFRSTLFLRSFLCYQLLVPVGYKLNLLLYYEVVTSRLCVPTVRRCVLKGK